MQDNFTGDTAEMIIRYMDGELSIDEKEAVENLLQNDASAQEQYQFFIAAKRSVQSEGIRQRVVGIQRNYLEEKNKADVIITNKKKRSSFFSPLISIAAILVFLLIGYGMLQYFTTTNQKVYNDAYIAYQLPVNRGDEKESQAEELYNTGNYKAAINLFNAVTIKSQKDYFTAGLSYLQLNNASAAIDAFQQVEKLNKSNSQKRYVQETDYYLMLAYLKEGNIENAENILDKIDSNKEHLFYSKAKTISRTKLMVLEWKGK